MRRAYLFKLYPTRAQASLLAQALEAHRLLYNTALQQRRDVWQQRGRSVFAGVQPVRSPARGSSGARRPGLPVRLRGRSRPGSQCRSQCPPARMEPSGVNGAEVVASLPEKPARLRDGVITKGVRV